jgi:hypothetical protein
VPEFSDATAAAVRRIIYERIVETAAAPSTSEVAANLQLPLGQVTQAFRALADAHIIVLEPGDGTIAWAPPFSSIRTLFCTRANNRTYFAPCAWDAFGIAAALATDADIEAECAWSGAPLACGVAGGRPYGDAVIHLLVPAAHFWDDIFFT